MEDELKGIADTYGFERQSRQLQEECAELIVAVNKYHRKPSAETRDNIIEELADVKIMITQIEYLLGCKYAVETVCDGKIHRQLERIKEADDATTTL